MLRWLLLATSALAVWAFDAQLLCAQDAWPAGQIPDQPQAFPRGPGYYISTWKILSAWILFAIWVKTTDWLSQDCLKYRQNYVLWNSVAFFPFLALFIFMWWLPFGSWWFYVDYFLLIAGIAAPMTVYVLQRNKTVESDEKIFTPAHIRFVVFSQLNKLGFKLALEKRGQHEMGPDVKIVAQGGATEQANNVNLLTARQSPGFLTARELIYDVLNTGADAAILDYGGMQVGVRYQIDGHWHANTPKERATADLTLAVMKQVANLNPNERRAKQAGTFGVEALKNKYTCRITSQGVETGERVLLQFDCKKLLYSSLEAVGMRQKMQEQLLEILGRKNGFVLFCSMPGGGLTTNFDAAMLTTDRFIKNFVAIEEVSKRDRELENIAVTTYDAAAGEGPETVLPKLIRTYPDVIIVRDIPNLETLKILCDEATGERMVISTTRAKEAVEALLRIMMLKIPPPEFAKAVTAVVNMRLIRKLCDNCKEKYAPPPEVLKQMGLPPGKIEALYRPRTIPVQRDKDFKPCEECKDLGYKGRTAIFELLVVDDAMRAALATQPKLDVLRATARQSKHRTLQDEGLLMVAKGITSLPELLRVLKV